MLNSTLNGLRFYNTLKYTDNLVQSTECLSLTPCHEKSPLTPCHGKTPLTLCHGLTCSKNSLTPCHELYRCNLATSSKFSIAIAIVNAGKISPVITLPMSRMYARSQAVKRARPSSSTRASSSSQHSGSSSSYKEPAMNPNITLTNRAMQDSEMRENKYRDKICNMCSDSTTSRYHHHFSSWNIRRMFLNMKVKPTCVPSAMTLSLWWCQPVRPGGLCYVIALCTAYGTSRCLKVLFTLTLIVLWEGRWLT